jgi:hypothetical protein
MEKSCQINGFLQLLPIIPICTITISDVAIQSTPAQPKGENIMEFEGFCVKCKKKVLVKRGEVKKAANGRKMAQGTCPECKTKVTRFLPSDKGE